MRFLGFLRTSDREEDDIEPVDDESTVLWTRMPRVSTEEEKRAADAERKKHVDRLRDFDDPFRPALPPHFLGHVPAVPVPTPTPPAFELSGPPTTPGMYLMRGGYLSRWSVVEVIRGPDGNMWAGWGSESAWKLGTRPAEWLSPALEGIPR